MATGTIILPISGAIPGDNSTNNAPPGIAVAKSSAAAPTPFFMQMLFDAATSEMAMWAFRMPQDYASAPVIKVQYKMASATSGNLIIEGRIAALTDADSVDMDANAFGSANTSGATAVPGTAGHLDEISLALTNADSLAAGDHAIFYFARDADNASDTATGDMEVVAVSVEYTTT